MGLLLPRPPSPSVPTSSSHSASCGSLTPDPVAFLSFLQSPPHAQSARAPGEESVQSPALLGWGLPHRATPPLARPPGPRKRLILALWVGQWGGVGGGRRSAVAAETGEGPRESPPAPRGRLAGGRLPASSGLCSPRRGAKGLRSATSLLRSRSRGLD